MAHAAVTRPQKITFGEMRAAGCQPPDRCKNGSTDSANRAASVLTHSFASRFCDGERFFGSAVLCEDRFGAGSPLEGLWVLVSMLDPVVNRGLEFGDVVEGPSPDALASILGVETLV